MRPSEWVSLLALLFIALGVRAQTEVGPSRHVDPGPADDRVLWRKDDIKGYGVSHADARQMAFQVASQELLSYLEKNRTPISWLPSLEYLESRRIVREIEQKKQPEGSYTEVTVRVELTEEKYKELLERDRLNRVEVRQVWWMRFLAGIVALLAVTAIYFRLEEITRGYYSRRLRVALVVCFALVGLGWWLIL